MCCNERHLHGGDWYEFKKEQGFMPLDFSISLNPLGLSKKVKEALFEQVEMPASYPDIHNKDLLEAICGYENVARLKACLQRGLTTGSKESIHASLDATNVVLGNGAAELIFRICEVIKPKKALIVSPCFSEYEAALTAKECHILKYVLREDDDFSLNEDFLDSISNELDIIFLCNPNNPTGKLIDKNLLDQIVSRANSYGITLVIDECFIDLSTRPSDSLVPELMTNKSLIILKALTKSHALAGLRLGYALSSNQDLVNKLIQHSQDWPISSFAQVAGVAALKDELYLQASREVISKERLRLEKELRMLGFSVYSSDANFILFKKTCDRSTQTEQMARTSLSKSLLNKGISIRDCSNFEGLGAGFFRIAVRTENENGILIKALREIKKEDGGLWQ